MDLRSMVAGAALTAAGWSMTMLADNIFLAAVCLPAAIAVAAACLGLDALSRIRRADTQKALAALIDEIEGLQKMCLDGSLEQPMLDAWGGHARRVIAKRLGAPSVNRFESSAGLFMRVPLGGHTAEAGNRWCWLSHRAERIHEFMREG